MCECLDSRDLAGKRGDGASASGSVGAGVCRAAGQLECSPHRALSRRDQIAVLTRAFEHERRRGVDRMSGDRRRAQPHLLVGAYQQPHLGKRDALGGKLLHRHGGQHQAALHVGDSRAGRAISRHRERTGQRLAQPKHRIGVTEQRHRLCAGSREA